MHVRGQQHSRSSFKLPKDAWPAVPDTNQDVIPDVQSNADLIVHIHVVEPECAHDDEASICCTRVQSTSRYTCGH
jgi:hypothetical protein